MAMRTLLRLAIFIALITGLAPAQGPSYAAYVSNGAGGWTPNTNGSGQNTVGYQPPSAYLYCYSGGAWNACSSGAAIPAASTATVLAEYPMPEASGTTLGDITANAKQGQSCAVTPRPPRHAHVTR